MRRQVQSTHSPLQTITSPGQLCGEKQLKKSQSSNAAPLSQSATQVAPSAQMIASQLLAPRQSI